MDVRDLLRGEFRCECGMTHSCEIKTILVEKGALANTRSSVSAAGA